VYIELVDALRCPRPHPTTPLVASVDTIADRAIVAGTLGCPVCDARYPVIDGAVVFDEDHYARLLKVGRSPTLSDDDVVRLAALLDLVEPGGVVLLHGEWAAAGDSLLRLADTALVLLNPRGPTSGRGVASPVYATSAPVAPGTLRGAALDSGADPGLVDSVIAALRPRGRLVLSPGQPAVDLSDMRELARDGSGWAGERLVSPAPADSPPVALSRGRRG
jgi:uncharacterized protein YbaR (Trm112 family)